VSKQIVLITRDNREHSSAAAELADLLGEARTNGTAKSRRKAAGNGSKRTPARKSRLKKRR
jgi:hypothetical protein